MSTSNKNSSNPNVKIQDTTKKIIPLQYPRDLGKYYIAFQFAQYSSTYTSLPRLGIGEDNYFNIGKIEAQIALPVPVNLLDDQQLDYNAFNLTNVTASAMGNLASQYGPRGMQQGINSALNVVSSVVNYQSVYTGLAVNPFMAVMFNGPKFKTHQFGWRFSPKDATESQIIVDIFNFMKMKSLPSYTPGGVGFFYPNVILTLIYPESARNHMYTFKPSVITQVSIHHAPSGTPSFFAGTNAPTEIELKIQLTEISIWTQEDYASGSSTVGQI